MHAEICIAMHSSMQMKLYRAAIIQRMHYQANGHKQPQAPMQQTFIFLSVHQYALIERSSQCAYYMA